MRRDEEINRFFNQVNQEFFLIKNHYKKCETIEQLQTCTDWMQNVSDKWHQKFLILEDRCSLFGFRDTREKFYELQQAMLEEWKELTEKMIAVVSPKVEPEEEPKPKPHVVIKGFC